MDIGEFTAKVKLDTSELDDALQKVSRFDGIRRRRTLLQDVARSAATFSMFVGLHFMPHSDVSWTEVVGVGFICIGIALYDVTR